MPEEYITEALELVSAWDVPDEDFAQTVNEQARLMAGFDPDELWEDHPVSRQGETRATAGECRCT